MEAILNRIKDGTIRNVKPAVVISNKADARALEIARQRGVDSVFIDDEGKKGANWEYDKRLEKCLKDHDVTPENGLICLAGFMRILSKELVHRYRGRILNIHPSLLPSFKGLNAQKQALEHGVKITGCTVHFIDEEVDAGPIIIQTPVEVKENDTPDTLAARILEYEHKIYPEAVRLFAEGKLSVSGRRVSTHS